MIRSWVVLLLLSICTTNSYKFLVYSPIFGYSHTNFMGAIADALTEAGHDVTMLMPIMVVEQENKTGVTLTKKVIKIPPDPRAFEMMHQMDVMLSQMWVMQPSWMGLMQVVRNISASFTYTCEAVISDDKLLKQLAEERFDVGISEALLMCGLALFEALKIPASIGATSTVHSNCMSHSIGEPITPSYVPGGMSTKGDRMGFIDRVMNVVDVVLGQMFFTYTFVEEIKLFRKKFGHNFKGYEEIMADSSYVLTNSNPYLDYPRPMLHKTIPIGGITVNTDPAKNALSKEWDSILNERNTTVYVSFGSVTKSIYMPDTYRNTLLEVFESMPNTTFIWKYEEEGSTLAGHLKNVHLSTWVPQNALLGDPRLTAFVTHGGLGSITELAYMGKPAVVIPIVVDQMRNAHMFAKHGGGIVLSKNDLEQPQRLRNALHSIFSDASYSMSAKRLSEMLLNQPISAKQLLVQHAEFAARSGRLPNLDPYGRHLSFIEYFLIDIVFAAVSVVVVVGFVVVKILRKCFSLTVKSKKD